MSTLGTSLLTGNAVESPFAITMLDGGLGAVPGTGGTDVTPRVDNLCWCACVVCVLPGVPSE
jgi:hypothetical protein